MAILHVDMDAFYASVEVREQPALAGRPVIVGGSAEGRGVVAAASYEARKFGVHSAMPMARALRLCPDAVRLPARLDFYQQISQQIRAIFARYTPEIEPLSLDEAFLDVTASEKLFGTAREVALRIKQDIRDELSLVASVGIAPNKFLAKIASDLDKPDGLVEVAQDEVQTFLDPLPVSRLWGVGKVTGARFEELGIRTIGQLRGRTAEFLTMEFGKFGSHLWELAHGRDPRPVISDHRAKSISMENTFATDVHDTQILRAWLMDMAEQVASRLRQQDFYGRTIQIKLRFADFKTVTRAHTLDEATRSTRDICHTALALLAEAWTGRSPAVRLLGVGVSGLAEVPPVPQQGDLFTTSEMTTDKQRELDELADAINNRFGKQQLRRGGGFH
ncbi:MAG: DNA polymerase IV [Thiohalophilus sp.]|uniref:DNA polymerase IV n=1 Tax=Thiohalophilus sp. TaxID=3028392 RepID=UPI00287023E2|nr:DNA polymerase IV [Thiohalophilus sp.]MDR9436490.1 DNA polymerase IV [Thiohalophilus sp.]